MAWVKCERTTRVLPTGYQPLQPTSSPLSHSGVFLCSRAHGSETIYDDLTLSAPKRCQAPESSHACLDPIRNTAALPIVSSAVVICYRGYTPWQAAPMVLPTPHPISQPPSAPAGQRRDHPHNLAVVGPVPTLCILYEEHAHLQSLVLQGPDQSFRLVPPYAGMQCDRGVSSLCPSAWYLVKKIIFQSRVGRHTL